MRFLVTGGAGFIGRRLVSRLAARGAANGWVLDNLHPQVHGENPSSPALPAGVTFHRGDVRDRKSLSSFLSEARPEVVFHLAAETGTGQSYDEPARYCEVNIAGTANLVEALRGQAGSRLRRIVLASSRAVYGEGLYRDARGANLVPPPRGVGDMKNGRFDPLGSDGTALTPQATPETAPPQPASVYAATKLMQEHLLLHCSAGAAWSPVILRLQNVYGPGQSTSNPYTGVLSIFSRQILEGRTLDIYEDGRIVRDFVFVDDVIDAMVAAAERPHVEGLTFNIGSGEATTILAAARILISLLRSSTAGDGYTISGRYRSGDVRHALADIGLARRALGWAPAISLPDGLALLAEWVKSSQKDPDLAGTPR